MRSLLAGLTCLTLVFAACGDEKAGDGAGAAPSVADLCSETDGLYVAFFSRYEECFSELSGIGFVLPPDAELANACEASLGAFVNHGSVLLGDSQAYEDCKAYIEESTCETVSFDAPNPCDDFLIGTVAEGGECESDEQCAGDSYCDRTLVGTCGECTPRKAEGASCMDNGECQGRNCSRGDCTTFKDVGGDCYDSEDCIGNLVCDSDYECARRGTPDVGDDCSDFLDCGLDEGLFCHEDLGKCVAFLEVGDACAAGEGLCNLLNYEWCDAHGTGTCAPPRMADVGDECSFITGEKCATGLLCDIDLDAGDPPPPGECIRPPAPGDECTVVDGESECGDFLMECVNGRCQYGSYTGHCPEMPE